MWDNPFAGLPAGYDMSGGWDPWSTAPTFSTEGMVGGLVNPYAPGFSGGTGGENTGISDTDRGRAASEVSSAAKKGDLQSLLKGLQAPQAPQPQRIASPNAPQTRQVQSQLSTLLASMGVTPTQMLRLSQTMRG